MIALFLFFTTAKRCYVSCVPPEFDLMIPASVGAFVREKRKELGLKPKRLAKLARIELSALNQFEEGRVGVLYSVLLRIAVHLGYATGEKLQEALLAYAKRKGYKLPVTEAVFGKNSPKE